MARNCSVFEMQNNGPLLKPDSVNCLQLPRSVICMNVVVIRLSSNTALTTYMYDEGTWR